jgi:hypothetical protein
MARSWGIGLALVALAAPAHAVSITIAGPSTGPLSAGVGTEMASGLTVISFEVALGQTTAIAAYDLSVAWDPTELSLSSAQQRFPDTSLAFPFFVSPVGGNSDGARAGVLGFVPYTTTALFRLTFQVLEAGLVDDGEADVRVFVNALANGPGIYPGTLTIDNPAGAGIDLVPTHAPEPTTALLVVGGLTGMALARRRRRARSGPPSA